MKNRKNKFSVFCCEYMISVLLFLVVSVFSLIGLQEAREAQQAEALQIAKESILRGVVSCYALEGFYPPTYEYLKEKYDIHVDEEKYTVFYDIFASNMMPDVTIIEK